MARSYQFIADHLGRLLYKYSAGDVIRRLEPKRGPQSPRVPGGTIISEPALERRWKLVSVDEKENSIYSTTKRTARWGCIAITSKTSLAL